MSLPIFDNHDDRIRYVELHLCRALCDLPQRPLPEGYRFAFYQPGDRDAWIDIEQSAKEFASYEQGLDAWKHYYGGHEDELGHRMIFVIDPDGRKVATATAYRDVEGRDTSGDAWLHWVAVRRDCQGRGLSKPLILHVLRIMAALGYTHAKIPTQTTSWVACKVYLDLGFRPLADDESLPGWRIVRRLTDHPSLAAFTPACDTEVLNPKKAHESISSVAP